MFKFLAVGAVAAYALYQSFFAGDRDDGSKSREYPQPPGPDERQHQFNTYSSEFSQPPVRRRDERQHQLDTHYSQPQIDDPPVETLRARAKQEADLMSKYFQQSQEAYRRRDHANAKALSERGKRHELRMEKLNAKASAIVFKDNNPDKDACEIDLHGLYVKEAIAYSEKALAKARRRGDFEIRLIVGQGNHSDRGIPRLKPAIQKAMRKRGLLVEVDSRNPGVLVVGW